MRSTAPLLTPAMLAIAVVFAAPAPAFAARVSGSYDEGENPVLFVRDKGAERNRLVVTVADTKGGVITAIEEKGTAPLVAVGRCQNRSPKHVVCPDDGGFVMIDTGLGDDSVSILDPTGASFEVNGGSGADHLRIIKGVGTLRGGPGVDEVVAAGGADILLGGTGRDRLRGGPGADFLSGDQGRPIGRRINSDLLDGGPGRDVASWGERGRRGIVVDLARTGPAGAPGERDDLRSIEDVVGSAGHDRLLGDRTANRLYGRGGRDLLAGRGGPDRLDGGTTYRFADGAPDGDPDRFGCGPGRDLVQDPALDPLDRDCERVAEAGFGVRDGEHIAAQPQPLGDNRYAFEVICSLQVLDCRRRVVLRSGGRLLARSRTVRTRRERTRIVVKLRRPLPATGLVTVRTEGQDRGSDLIEPGDSDRWIGYEGFTYRLRR